MARRITIDTAVADLLDKMEPEIREKFLTAVQDLRDKVQWGRFLEAVRQRNVEAALNALSIEEAAFGTFRIALQLAFDAGGALQSNSISTPPAPPASSVMSSFPQDSAVVFRWDMSNPRAEQIIRTQSSRLITNIVAEQRASIREALNAGYAQGQHPDTIARGIAGRMNQTTGKREGGIIGLSKPQAQHVASMRERLSSGDPAEMAKVFEMQRRDKRFDGIIRQAIESGKPMAKADIEQITRRYADRLLALRAETIARTETGDAVMSARAESMRQALNKSGYPEEAVGKEWRHGAKLENARMQHVAMHKKRVTGLNTPFTLPDGTQMQHPMDRAGGAKHTIGCRCTVRYQIDYSWGVD